MYIYKVSMRVLEKKKNTKIKRERKTIPRAQRILSTLHLTHSFTTTADRRVLMVATFIRVKII